MPWSAGRSDRDRRKPSNWDAVRRAVLERDGHRCTIQGPRCIGRANHVDHTDEATGPEDVRLEVLRSACQPCHMGRTAGQAHAVRADRHRPARLHPGG